MTLIVENGTIVANANSYVTVAEADSYWTDRVDEVWTDAEDAQKERALIQATDYMKQAWRLIWKGSIVDSTQAQDWPRRGVDVPDFFDPFFRQVNVPLQFQDTYFIPEDEIPNEVKTAQILLARDQMDSSGNATITLQDSLGRKTKREKVGSLEVEYMNSADAGNTRQTTLYWTAKKVIEPFLREGSTTVGLLVRS